MGATRIPPVQVKPIWNKDDKMVLIPVMFGKCFSCDLEKYVVEIYVRDSYEGYDNEHDGSRPYIDLCPECVTRGLLNIP